MIGLAEHAAWLDATEISGFLGKHDIHRALRRVEPALRELGDLWTEMRFQFHDLAGEVGFAPGSAVLHVDLEVGHALDRPVVKLVPAK